MFNSSIGRPVVILLLAFLCLNAASAATIKVLVLDAHNGHPIKDTDVSVDILGEKGASSYKTDASGAITVEMDPSAKFIPSAGWHVTCRRVNSANPHWFSVDTITQQGAVDENTCGKAKAEPLKGVVIIFTRKSTFFENMARE